MTSPSPYITGTRDERVEKALEKWANSEQKLAQLRQTWTGDRPIAYLSPESREALGQRMTKLGINYPRLAVESLAERMTLAGLEVRGSTDVWGRFVAANGPELAELVHVDRLLYGSSYVTVWATETGRPTLTGDGPFTMTHHADPATGETLWAARRYKVDETDHRIVVYTPEEIVTYRARFPEATAYSYARSSTVPNVLGEVPVVPFIRRASLTDPATGESAVTDLLELTDATTKVLGDAMVTSEFYARPRRWATGLEIVEDEDGNAVDPFGEGRFLQSEAPETRFGQLEPARLDGYADMLATLTQSVGALSGLPPHYLGLHGDQPASADGIRAAEAQLTARARAEQRRTTNEWARVAWLLDAVVRGVSPLESELRGVAVSWASPETNTPAMAADAAAKLRGIGVPLDHVLEHELGIEPTKAAQLAALAARESRTARGDSAELSQ